MWTSTGRGAGVLGAALVLGGLAAYGLRRGSFAGRDWAEGNFMAPLIVPTIIVAIALYLGLAKIGLLGSSSAWSGPHRAQRAACHDGDGRGHPRVRPAHRAGRLEPGRFVALHGAKVMLPNLAPSVFAAWIFAFIGSFDEVIVTSFIAGKYETVPKKMFNELILEVNPTITAVATLLIGFTVLALAAVALILGRAGKLKQTIV